MRVQQPTASFALCVEDAEDLEARKRLRLEGDAPAPVNAHRRGEPPETP